MDKIILHLPALVLVVKLPIYWIVRLFNAMQIYSTFNYNNLTLFWGHYSHLHTGQASSANKNREEYYEWNIWPVNGIQPYLHLLKAFKNLYTHFVSALLCFWCIVNILVASWCNCGFYEPAVTAGNTQGKLCRLW